MIKLEKINHFVGSRIARLIVLGVFVAQAVILAFTMHVGVPPDENNHIQFTQYYAQHSVSPFFSHQTPTFNLGDKTREVDYMYAYLTSLLYRISPLSDHANVIMLRLLTVATALLTMVLLARLFKKLGASNSVITVGLLALTNLPMVLMLSSAVNNDVFVWLGTILGLLLVVKLWREPTLVTFLWIATVAALGGLFKRDLFVLSVVLAVLAVAIVIKKRQQFFASFKRQNWQVIVASLVLIMSVGLFVERVGGNIIDYGSIAPSCNAVQGEKACSVFWGNQRDIDFATKNPAAFHRWVGPAHYDNSLMSPVLFVVRWASDSFYNNVDIQTQGWHHEVSPSLALVAFLGAIFLALIVTAIWYDIRHRAEPGAKMRLIVMATAWVYAASQLIVNYSTYRHYHIYGVALNGRYILPSIFIMSLLGAYATSQILRKRPVWLLIISVIVCLTVILGSGILLMFSNSQLFTGQY